MQAAARSSPKQQAPGDWYHYGLSGVARPARSASRRWYLSPVHGAAYDGHEPRTHTASVALSESGAASSAPSTA